MPRREPDIHWLCQRAEHELALLSLDMRKYGKRLSPQSPAMTHPSSASPPPEADPRTFEERYDAEVARASAVACYIKLCGNGDSRAWYRAYHKAFLALQQDLRILRSNALFSALTIVEAAGTKAAGAKLIREELTDDTSEELWAGFWQPMLRERLKRGPWPTVHAYMREWWTTHGISKGVERTLSVLASMCVY